MTTRSPLLFSAVLLFAAAPLTAQAPAQSPRHGITAEDYFSFRFAADPHISPDGRHVVYLVSRVDRERNRRVPSVWIVATDGSAPPKLLVDEAFAPGAPRWSPDGAQVAFTSSRNPDDATPRAGSAAAQARPQLWTVAAQGGTPRRVTNLAHGVSNCSWSPDGTRFACLTRTGPSDSLNVGPDRSDVRHYSHSNYKFNDTGWFDDERAHICVIDAATGSSRQITEGDDWNDTDPVWSPDGQRIAFVSDRTGKEFDHGRNTDIWTIPATGGHLTKISTSPGRDAGPAWSPDAKTIAFVNAAGEDDPAQIYIAPSEGGTPKLAAKDLDLIPGALQWDGDGKGVLFETGIRGENHLFRVEIGSGAVHQLSKGPRAVRSVSLARKTPQMAFLANDFQHLDDIYVANSDGTGEKKLTSINADLWKSRELASVERMTYKGADGWDIDGFLVKPLGWVAGRKYPMILSVHGGPAGQYGVDWFHEFQVDAANGYAVFFANPRGSTGYGIKFQKGIVKEWGGKDFIDIMNGVRAVTAANPWIDTTRMGMTGGSYGGFMANWIVGHTNAFKAVVSLRGISNFISDDATRDGAYGHAGDFGGDIFDQHDLYWDRSPIKYVKNVTTPILILHSDNDYRVPLEQGEQWFRALKHFGKTAEIVMFPRENHNLTRTGEPKHLVESLNWQLWWFDKYLNGNAKAVPPDRMAGVRTTQ